MGFQDALIHFETLGQPAYDLLLDEEGSLAAAAYRLACWKILAHENYRPPPSPVQVHVAARQIADNASSSHEIPDRFQLADECEALGLSVLPEGHP